LTAPVFCSLYTAVLFCPHFLRCAHHSQWFGKWKKVAGEVEAVGKRAQLGSRISPDQTSHCRSTLLLLLPVTLAFMHARFSCHFFYFFPFWPTIITRSIPAEFSFFGKTTRKHSGGKQVAINPKAATTPKGKIKHVHRTEKVNNTTKIKKTANSSGNSIKFFPFFPFILIKHREINQILKPRDN